MSKYDIESVRLRPASNGFILEFCELTQSDDSDCCVGGYRRDYRTEVFTFGQFEKAAKRMMAIVRTVIPPKMLGMETESIDSY